MDGQSVISGLLNQYSATATQAETIAMLQELTKFQLIRRTLIKHAECSERVSRS